MTIEINCKVKRWIKITTFELLDQLITKMEDELYKGNTVNTEIVDEKQLLEIKRISEAIVKESSLAIKHL